MGRRWHRRAVTARSSSGVFPRGTSVRTLPHNSSVNSVAFSPTGGHWHRGAVMAGSGSGAFPRGPVHTLTGHTGTVYSVAFSPDGQTLASSGGGDNTVRLWSTSDGVPVRTLTGYTQYRQLAAFSRRADTSLIGGGGLPNNAIRLWSVSDPCLNPHWFGALGSLLPDGQTLASGAATTRSGSGALPMAPCSTPSPGIPVPSCRWPSLPTGRHWHGGGDRTVRLWSVSDGALLHTLTGHTHTVNSVAFSSRRADIISGAMTTQSTF